MGSLTKSGMRTIPPERRGRLARALSTLDALSLPQEPRMQYLLLTAIVLAALALRLHYFAGMGANDDSEYADQALRLVSGGKRADYPFTSIDSLRSLMILPVALCYKLFGVSTFTTSVYPLLCSLGTIVLTFFLARRLFGLHTAFASSLLLCFFPLDVVYSTQLVPTVPLAFLWTASTYLFVRAESLAEGRHDSVPAKSKLMFGASGLLLGAAWLVNEPAPMLLLILGLYPLFTGRRQHLGHLVFALTAVGVVVLECAVFKQLTGSWFWRLSVVHQAEMTVETNTSLAYYPRVFFKVIGFDAAAHEGHFGLFWYLFAFSAAYLLWKGRKSSFFLLLGSAIILVYLQLGVQTVTGRPIAKFIRYIEMLLPFVVMPAAFGALCFSEQLLSRRYRWIPLLIVLVSNLIFLPSVARSHISESGIYVRLAERAQALPADKPLYVDMQALPYLRIHLGGQRDVRGYENNISALDDAYIITRTGTEAGNAAAADITAANVNAQLVETIGILAAHGTTTEQASIYFIPRSTPPVAERQQAAALVMQSDDPKGDAQCAAGGGASPAYLDILGASVYQDRGAFTFTMDLAKAAPASANKNRAIVYVWYLDFDKSEDTGQYHFGVGSEFNIRVDSREGHTALFVDEEGPGGDFISSSTGVQLRVEGTRIEAKVPLSTFGGRSDPRWVAESREFSLTPAAAFDCSDYTKIVEGAIAPPEAPAAAPPPAKSPQKTGKSGKLK